ERDSPRLRRLPSQATTRPRDAIQSRLRTPDRGRPLVHWGDGLALRTVLLPPAIAYHLSSSWPSWLLISRRTRASAISLCLCTVATANPSASALSSIFMPPT